MKTLLDLVPEPIIIGMSIIAVCIVGSVYVLNQWYYADFDPEPIPTKIPVSELVKSPALLVDIDLSRLTFSEAESDSEGPTDSDSIQIESKSGSYELTPAETLPPPLHESPHGLGPYPEIPLDYPRQNVWAELEKAYYDGYASIEHELIHRVLIKLWKQGKKTDSGVLSEQNGKVYPLYKDTLYVKWSEVENAEGSVEEYMNSYLSHYFFKDYKQAVVGGTQPSWIKVIPREDGGIDPYAFLDLP